MLYYLGSHRWLWGKGGGWGSQRAYALPPVPEIQFAINVNSANCPPTMFPAFHTLSTLDRSSISPGQHESPSARPPLLRLLDTRLIPARGPRHHIRPRPVSHAHYVA